VFLWGQLQKFIVRILSFHYYAHNKFYKLYANAYDIINIMVLVTQFLLVLLKLGNVGKCRGLN
jgi:hypothetical protein